jgi:CRISPR/Cas system CSM-associated protein Csm3 (group 7 of RAMP superfamily)
LKGALRAEIERYLIHSYYDPGAKRWPSERLALQPCMAATRLSEGEEALKGAGKYRGHCTYPLSGQAHGICPACYLLGAQGLVGFVKVPFLWCDLGPDALYSARIDRSSGTVAQGTNRKYQLLPQGTRFSGKLWLTASDAALDWTFGKPRPLPGNPDQWLGMGWDPMRVENELLLDRLRNITHLGGYKSKGCGYFRTTRNTLPIQYLRL